MLVAADPGLSSPNGHGAPPLLEAEAVRKVYRTGAGEVPALREVSLGSVTVSSSRSWDRRVRARRRC